MKLILNSDVQSLGRKGDVVDVAKGYARNYLLPKKLAIVATTNNLELAQKLQEKRQEQAQINSELAESIKKHGVIQPVLVRKDGKGFELVAGERRFRAAKLAKLKKIPVVVSNISDVQSLEIAILENIQREDLNPLEVAKGYQRLKDEFGYTQEAVAKSVGKPRSSVANSLRLLTLSPKIQDEIDKGVISEGHAKVLLSVDGVKAEQLLMRIISENLSVRDLEKQITESSPQTSKKEKKSRDELNLESALSSRIGSKVTIEDKDGKGKMVIKYYSYEELDGIIEKISH